MGHLRKKLIERQLTFKNMNRRTYFIGMSLFSVLAIGLLFFLLGTKTQSPQNNTIISATEEMKFVSDVNELDSLYAKLQKAAYSKDVSSITEVNVRWEKQRNDFLEQYKTNAVLSKLSNRIIDNYRQRVKLLKDTYRIKSAALSDAQQLRALIKVEETKKEELKVENQMIKQALLTL